MLILCPTAAIGAKVPKNHGNGKCDIQFQPDGNSVVRLSVPRARLQIAKVTLCVFMVFLFRSLVQCCGPGRVRTWFAENLVGPSHPILLLVGACLCYGLQP